MLEDASFSEMVSPVIVTFDSSDQTPPMKFATLFEIVVSTIDPEAPFTIAIPPAPEAVFPEMLESEIVSAPLLSVEYAAASGVNGLAPLLSKVSPVSATVPPLSLTACVELEVNASPVEVNDPAFWL